MRSTLKTRGLTLVELMIALAILAIAVLGVTGVIINTIRFKEKNREFDLAKQAAASKIEQIRATDWIDPTDPTNPLKMRSNEGHAVYQDWLVTDLQHSERPDPDPAKAYKAFGKCVFYPLNPALRNPDVQDIEIVIEWTGIMGKTQHKVRTMFSRPQ